MEIVEYCVKSMMNVDVFQRVKTLYEQRSVTDPEDLRFLESEVRDYRRNGLDLD